MAKKIDKENILVAFSGGRTSAFMCWWLKENFSHLYNLFFVFANTGQEHNKTLEFVDKVDKYLNLNLTWVEACVPIADGKGTTYRVVDFATADRIGNVFEQVIKKFGLPNKKYLHCTREMKNIPMYKWASANIGKYRIALGIRFDEFRRVKLRQDAVYPLATIGKFTKQDILDFWSSAPFDLEIEEHQGNCLWCYKKLALLASQNPEWFEFPRRMEEKYRFVKTKDEIGERKIFRHFRTSEDILNNTGLVKNIKIDECAEECGSILSEFESEPAQNYLF